MPKPKNTTARIIVPIVGILLMVLVGWAFYQNGNTPPIPPAPAANSGTSAGTPTAAAPEKTPDAPKSTDAGTTATSTNSTAAPAPATTPSATPATTPATTPSSTKFRARSFAGDPSAHDFASLGTLDRSKDDTTLMKVAFSSTGAGVKSIKLAEYFETIERLENVTIQEEHSLVVLRDADGKPKDVLTLTPFAAISVMVNGQAVLLTGSTNEPVWRQIAPGHFEAFVEDEVGTNVLRVERQFTKVTKAFDLKVTQKITNLAAFPVKVQFFQIGPVDTPRDRLAYVGDRRRLHFGHLLNATGDPSRSVVVADKYSVEHSKLLGSRDGSGRFAAESVQWPNIKSKAEGFELVWVGLTNRYFGITVMPDYVQGTAASKAFGWVSAINRVVLDLGYDTEKHDLSVVGLRLDGAEALLDPAGGAKSVQDLSHVVYVGPLDADVFKATEPTKSLGASGLIVHNMGGPCSFCTFGWLTDSLLWLLQSLHSITQDWAISIMLLVLVVRTCLHPVTKWSQIRMTRFGKQMQGIGPKMKVLQEKYKDDKVKLQQETGRLWREEGVSPAGMLGCLPMVFQMPVWIALYATLFFAVELRHQGGFYGVFQSIQPKTSPFWYFFGDLAEPDRFWYWKNPISIPLLSMMIGKISSLNIMPFILGVVFFIQQKYLKPPTTATLTPEQEMQQKMVQWMTVILFPVMMYPAPCGLTLYFCTNSILSILENRYIRRHIDELDKKNPPVLNAQGRKVVANEKPGFVQRMMQAAEAKRKEMEEAQAKAMKNAKKKR